MESTRPRSTADRPPLPRLVAAAVTVLILTMLLGVGQTAASSPGAPSSPATAQSPNMAAIEWQNQHLLTIHGKSRHMVLGQQAIRIRIPATQVDSPVEPTVLIGNTWQVADWAV